MKTTIKLNGRNRDGVSFTAKYVPPNEPRWHKDSDQFKQWGAVLNEYDEAIVLIFDRRFDHHPEGQFVSSYEASTVLEHGPEAGLCLQGDVSAWHLSSEQMQHLHRFVAVQEDARRWKLACEFDNIAFSEAEFAVFSENNPHA